MFEQAGVLPLFIKENRTAEEAARIERLYRKTTADKVLREATARKIVPFAAKVFCDLELDAEFWKQPLEKYRVRNERIIAMLDRVYETLEKHGVKKMFVTENAGALLAADGDIALFASGDVDNCADIAEYDKITEAFEELGFEKKERYSLENLISVSFYPHDADIDDRFSLNVAFHPLTRLKLPCFVETDAFVNWNDLRRYRDTAIVLPPSDALMYICMLHISLHSFSRAPDARLYRDIINLSALPIDYDRLAVWAKTDRTETRLAVAGRIAKYLFDVDIPGRLLMQRHADRVLKLVYDPENGDLLYEPGKINVMLIEWNCDDKGPWHGIKEMLFPEKTWIAKTYGSVGLKGTIKHILRILR